MMKLHLYEGQLIACMFHPRIAIVKLNKNNKTKTLAKGQKNIIKGQKNAAKAQSTAAINPLYYRP
ncbi:MAG: hypothetical protein ACTHNW_17445 [Mucilaginibacter sp.]